MRRRQMRNLYEYDEDERPSLSDLENFRAPAEIATIDYYNGPAGDKFFELGEWLSVENRKRQREHEQMKKDSKRAARQRS